MTDNKQATSSRRTFFRDVAAGAAVGAVLPGVLTASAAAAEENGFECSALAQQQAEREAFELHGRAFFQAYDSFDLDTFMSFFADNAFQQDVTLGDLSDFGGPPGSCSIHPKVPLRQVFAALFERFKPTGGVAKFTHASGSVHFGGGVEVKALAGNFFIGGWDTLSYIDLRGGKIFRRNDHWDTAQVTPQDIAVIHPKGVPRFSCEALPEPGDIANASPEFYAFVRHMSRALSAGAVDSLVQLFADDVMLIHPLLTMVDGAYGPFNAGIQVQGRKGAARFFKALTEILPDAQDSSLVHVVGSSVGGAFEWRSGGVTARQGIARNGILGVTAIDLFGGKIRRISVKFDTLQMTRAQRASVRSVVARECLVPS